jgi:hypothetical protein
VSDLTPETLDELERLERLSQRGLRVDEVYLETLSEKALSVLPALIAAARERDRIVARIHRLRDGVDIPGDQVKDYLLGNDEEG